MDSLSVIKDLYEQGEFETARVACLGYINSDEIKKSELYLWIAKCTLNLCKTPLDEERMDTMHKAVFIAYENSGNLEEVFFIEKEILSELYKLKKRNVMEYLYPLIEEPTFEQTKAYAKLIDAYEEAVSTMIGCAGCSSIVQQMCKETGLDFSDFYDQNCKEIIEHIENENASANVSVQERAISRKIFENAVAKFENNKDVNIDYAKKVIEVLLQEFMVAELLASYASKHSEIDNNDKTIALKLQAEILDYMLNATLTPNGTPFSLVQSVSRKEDIENLTNIYNEIAELDSEFVVPNLPSSDAFGFENSTNKSGGCYVATAVYGSYDCPEVWTLRRFRDNSLAKSFFGRLFIYLYYAVSPTFVKWFGETEWFKNMWKPILDEKVKHLNRNGVENTPYNDRQW